MQLRDWLFKEKKTQRWAARQLNITESYFSLVKTGTIVPGRKLAIKIDTLTRGNVTFEEMRGLPSTKPARTRKESRFVE